MNILKMAQSFFESETEAESAQPWQTDRAKTLRKTVERAQLFQNMVNQPGWQELIKDQNTHIEILTSKLLVAKDMKEVRRLQAQVEEASFWMNYVDQEIEAGESASLELRQLTHAKETA